MTAAEILSQIEGLEPSLQRAYLDSVRLTVDSATVAEVERLLAEGDEAELAELLSLGALAVLLERIRAAFVAGGQYEIGAIFIPGVRQEFDPATESAQAALTVQIRTIREQAVASVRDAVHEAAISRRVIGGTRTDRQASLDLIGRRSAQTGARTGGTIGLPGHMAQYVTNARNQLLSGDAAQMKQYLQRVRRDRRFDSIVRRAIATGKPIAAKDIDKITGRYAERLLRTHTEMLAKTAAAESFHAGRDQAWEQLVAQGLDRSKVEKEWRDRADEKVRNSHRDMRGQRVVLGQPFVTGAGAMLRYPGDSSLGAGMDEIAGCRCVAIYHLKG